MNLFQIYKLKTVTYGTTPACYLSARVLKQLAIDEKDNFLIAANIVLQDMYLDDILTGCSNLKKLVQQFESDGMSLHEWCFLHSNGDLTYLQSDQLSEEGTVKTLSVLRNSSSDTFCFKVHITETLVFAERDVFSQIARLFDPLDILGPVIRKDKFFMQGLWLLKVDWHEKVPAAVAKKWSVLVQFLPAWKR
ncbi:uncharacterized protein NPIL_41141 [Nephila pilipes]|uniref:Uncharacterized protein n=1 Tax=Nephila pilipes TaxID=299642 RepID=A0A8X6MTC5_NEPPI|nr:uncharacterized protein NPIL_41141 [Nephila pilipes]